MATETTTKLQAGDFINVPACLGDIRTGNCYRIGVLRLR